MDQISDFDNRTNRESEAGAQTRSPKPGSDAEKYDAEAPIWRVAPPSYQDERKRIWKWLTAATIVSLIGAFIANWWLAFYIDFYASWTLKWGIWIASALIGIAGILTVPGLVWILAKGNLTTGDAGSILKRGVLAPIDLLIRTARRVLRAGRVFVPRRFRISLGDQINRLIDRHLPPQDMDSLDREIASRLPEERFPWLWKKTPHGLELSPIIDSRLPDGTKMLAFTRRLISRRLVLVAMQSAAAAGSGLAVLAIALFMIAASLGVINTGREFVYREHVAALTHESAAAQKKADAAWEARKANYQHAVQAWKNAEEALNFEWSTEQAKYHEAYEKTAAENSAIPAARHKWLEQQLAADNAKLSALKLEWNAEKQKYSEERSKAIAANDATKADFRKWYSKHSVDGKLTPVQIAYVKKHFVQAPLPTPPNRALLEAQWQSAHQAAQNVERAIEEDGAVNAEPLLTPAQDAYFKKHFVRVPMPQPPSSALLEAEYTTLRAQRPESAVGPRPGSMPMPANALPPPPKPFMAGCFAAGGLMLFFLAIFVFAYDTMMSVRVAEQKRGERFRLPFKDSYVRWHERAPDRRVFLNGWRRAFLYATTFLSDKPTFELGKATGYLRAMGIMLAPPAGAAMAIDAESLLQNVLIYGGTGTGKTFKFLRPLARKIMRSKKPRYGIIALDEKGDLYRALADDAAKSGRGKDVVIFGPGYAAVNPLADASPDDLAQVIRALTAQESGGEQSSAGVYFAENVAMLVGHAARIAQAVDSYDMSTICAYVLNDIDVTTGKAISGQRRLGDAISSIESQPESVGLKAAVFYFEHHLPSLHQEDRSRILHSAKTLLEKVVVDERMTGLLRPAPGALSVSQMAFSGKILLSAIGSATGGMGGRLMTMLIKSAFMQAAKLRRVERGDQYCMWEAPVAFIADEYQSIVTAGGDLADADFWNGNRSAGIAGIIATQAPASLTLSIGDKAKDNMVQNFWTRAYLPTEDPEMIKEVVAIAGEHLRTQVVEDGHFESVPQWEAVTGLEYLPPAQIDRENAVFEVLAAQRHDLKEEIRAGAGKGSRVHMFQADLDELPTHDAHMMASMPKDEHPWHHNFREYQRVQDQRYRFLNENNRMSPAMSTAMITQMTREHAFIVALRSGELRMDVCFIGDNHLDLEAEAEVEAEEAADLETV